MGSALAIPLILIAVVLIGGLAYWSYLQRKRRREALAVVAQRLGWQFDPRRDSFHDDEYAHFEIFRRGHGRYAYNTLQGELTIGVGTYPAKMGDFTYKVTSGSGKSRSTRTYRFSYLIVHLPFRNIPDLLIRPEGFFDKLTGAFGFDDIDFESAEFSRRFYVKSSDKRFAYDVVHPRMMEFLLRTDPSIIDIEHGKCCVTDGRSRWSPDEFCTQLEWACDFLECWPDHVKADLKL